MAHMVFKIPLQNQTTRQNYIKQRQELRRAKELGLIDAEVYKDEKKNLLPDPPSFNLMSRNPSAISVAESGSTPDSASSSISAGSSVQYPTSLLPPEKRKGSILDRNNVARLVYKPDAQTEEEREAKKEAKKMERKAQKAQAQAERIARLGGSYDYSVFSLSPVDHLASGLYSIPSSKRTPSTQTSTSDSLTAPQPVKSSSQRKNFNIFRKLSASASRNSPSLDAPPLLDAPPIPRLSQERISVKSNRRPGSADTSSTAKSSITRRNTESYKGSSGGEILDVMPMTFADIFLFGPPPGSRSRTSSRRHSFSSQNGRPNLASSRTSTEAPTGMVIRKSHEEFVFDFRPSSREIGRLRLQSPQEQPQDLPQQQPTSTVLQDIFLSLLNDFSDTSLLFSYPKYGRVRRDSFSSSFRSIARSIRNDEEAEIGKAIGGEESFFIDESTAMLKNILEKRTWFFMAMKWLSFGRVLFSPGHHIIELNGDVEISGRKLEVSILDLDGSVTADWSWHLADEYPFAKILNVLLPSSPRPPRNSAAPSNLDSITATTLSNLSALPSNSVDVITSHNLPRLLLGDKNKSPEELHIFLTTIFRECARVLKPSGYFETTVVDPLMNNMGPRTRNWIAKHIALHNMKPSKMVIAALEQLSGQGERVLFNEVKECWVWMPTTSIGDELSTVTSMVGRHLYDELFAPDEREDEEGQRVEVAYGVFERKECKMWKDEKIIEECQKENTAFRWLKCYARKA